MNITGATAATYTAQLVDEGAKLRVVVTATNVDGTATANSDATDTVAKSLPVNSAVPKPTGTAARANVLTAVPGTWAGVGNTYKYQWQRDTGSGYANITGATAATYTVTLADVGSKLRVTVTATNVDGTASAALGGDRRDRHQPAGHERRPGRHRHAQARDDADHQRRLLERRGQHLHLPVAARHGRRLRDIAGATKNTYVLVPDDTGATIRSKVTATNPDASESAVSVAVGPVADAKPVNTVLPVLSGTAQRTKALTATSGTWTGAGNTYAFQWQRDEGSGFTDIANAKAASYTLTTDDLGAKVRVAVVATNVDAVVTAYSAASATVTTALPVNGALPVASGTTRTGLAVTSTSGTWTPAGPTYTYQWQRDSGSGFADISGATAATYTLTNDDAAAKVRSKVTATNSDGATSAVSKEIGPVLSTPANTDAPSISGTLTDASTLTADPGDVGLGGQPLAHLQVPVGPLPGGRGQRQLDRLRAPGGRDERHVRDGRRRRRDEARRPRDGDQHPERRHDRRLGRHQHARRPRADQLRQAGDLRHRRGQVGPDRLRGHLERPADQGRLPVAPLRGRRHGLRRHRRRGREDLHPGRRRHRQEARRPRQRRPPRAAPRASRATRPARSSRCRCRPSTRRSRSPARPPVSSR